MITDEMLIKIGKSIANKIRLEKRDEGNHYANLIRGMEQVLDILGIKYEYKFNDDVTEIIAIKINGITIEI